MRHAPRSRAPAEQAAGAPALPPPSSEASSGSASSTARGALCSRIAREWG